jgi:hypothetical protein
MALSLYPFILYISVFIELRYIIYIQKGYREIAIYNI